MRREPDKWETQATVSFINTYLEGCRVVVLRAFRSALTYPGMGAELGNMFLTLCSASGQLLLSLLQSFQRSVGSCLRFYCSYTYTHLHTPKDKALLANEKWNFSSFTPLSSLAAPSQRRMGKAAVTGTLQCNKTSSKIFSSQSICGVRNTQR